MRCRLAALRLRYEFPNSKNRWEFPLFHVNMTPNSGSSGNNSSTANINLGSGTEHPGVDVAPPVAPVSIPVKKSSWKPKTSTSNSAATSSSAPAGSTPTLDCPVPGDIPSLSPPQVSFSGSRVQKLTGAGEAHQQGQVMEGIAQFLLAPTGAGGGHSHSSGAGSSGDGGRVTGALAGSGGMAAGAVAPLESTVSIPHLQAHILYELDRISGSITERVLTHMKQHPIDSSYSIIHVAPPLTFLEYDRVFTIHRQVSAMELHGYRRQFIKVNTVHPPAIGNVAQEDINRVLGSFFIDFLSAQL